MSENGPRHPIDLFYAVLSRFSGTFGDRIFLIISSFVALGYFLFFPARSADNVRFFRTLFPESGSLYPILCALRQYRSFTTVFLDRLRVMDVKSLGYTAEGWHLLEDAVKNRSGGILLMSHMGNWEVAARLMKRDLPDVRLLLYLGVKDKERLEGLQKKAVAKGGIRIIAVDGRGGNPFEIVDGVNFLRSGGLVSLTGDRLWGDDPKTVTVPFLGREIRLPMAPHILALLSGAPIYVFFAFRSGPGQYHFEISGPFPVRAHDRREKEAAVRRSALRYALFLEKAVRRYPDQWYHFESVETGPCG